MLTFPENEGFFLEKKMELDFKLPFRGCTLIQSKKFFV